MGNIFGFNYVTSEKCPIDEVHVMDESGKIVGKIVSIQPPKEDSPND